MAVTARIAGNEAGGALIWEIQYDDVTRDVTTTASGTGFCLVTVQITATVTRSVAYFPAAGAVSVKPTLAAQMAAADFQVVVPVTDFVLVAGVNPNQVSRIVGKAGSTVGGLNSTSVGSST